MHKKTAGREDDTRPTAPTGTAPALAVVFSGGVALGAYEAGSYAALEQRQLRPEWIAGSSIGAVNGAIIAGNPPSARIERLRQFWNAAAAQPLIPTWPAGLPSSWPAQRAVRWMAALRARTWGSPGIFWPRVPSPGVDGRFPSFYDLRPLRKALERLVDFDRLNGGDVRLTVVVTDIETGEEVTFDTGHGEQIEAEHLLASCGFLPEFPPVEIAGRALGDGGLSNNAPVHVVLGSKEARDRDLLCLVVDLFPRTAKRPHSLEAAATRRRDLLFSSQTLQRLTALGRERALRVTINDLTTRLASESRDDPAIAGNLAEASASQSTVLYLSYDARAEAAGPESHFDFSEEALRRRWEAGAADMAQMLALHSQRANHTESKPLSVLEFRSGCLEMLPF